MKQIDYDSLFAADQRTYDEIATIRARNAQMVAEIEAMGGQVDIETARFEHLLMSLVDMEIITVSQLLSIQKDWELALKPQVRGIRDRLRAARAEAQKQARTKKLILPPGMQNGNG